MNQYIQLIQDQRYQIYILMKTGHKQSDIADLTGVDKSTISRHLRHNCGLKDYRPQQAHRFCLLQGSKKAMSRIDSSIWSLVEVLIHGERSPEQISGWLHAECQYTFSAEWINQYILTHKQSSGILYKYLRDQKQLKKRYGTYSYRGQIPQLVSIGQRTAVVDSRSLYGDWEHGSVIGKNHLQALVVMVERKSRLTHIANVIRNMAENVPHAIFNLLSTLKPWVHTLPAENGREFTQRLFITKKLKARFYSAHPNPLWRCGLNENTSGLIRQYFSKRHDFTNINEHQVEHVMDKLNNRPRKFLGFKTPNEVFFRIKLTVALAT